MYGFAAHSMKEQIIINSQAKYRRGEILTRLLNMSFKKLEEKYLACRELEHLVLYPFEQGEYDYNRVVYSVQGFFSYLNDLVITLPPYNRVLKPEELKHDALLEMLTNYKYLFKEGKKKIEEHDDGDLLLHYETIFVQQKYIPAIDELNRNIGRIYKKYMELAEDILRVPYVYSVLLDDYIHKVSSMKNYTAVADAVNDYMGDTINLLSDRHIMPYKKLSGAPELMIFHTPLPYSDNKEKSGARLWEMIYHKSIGSFLYLELFRGLESGCVPKRCKNCGRYFLLTSGYNADFCERKITGEAGKTCRDIGARKTYDEKVKNDPVWLAYQRAYKTHYARVSKKKMTKAEFSEWADMAIELRDRALAGKIDFDEYAKILKK